MRKLAPLALLLAISAAAQKKPITLETLSQTGRGGRGGDTAHPLPSAWLPDGKSFLYRQGRSLMIYDAATQVSRLLIDTTPLAAAAVNPPAEEGPTDWTNRRSRIGGLEFSADGKLL